MARLLGVGDQDKLGCGGDRNARYGSPKRTVVQACNLQQTISLLLVPLPTPPTTLRPHQY